MSTTRLQDMLSRESTRSSDQGERTRSLRRSRWLTGAALVLAGWIAMVWYWELSSAPVARQTVTEPAARTRGLPAAELAERIAAAAPFGQSAGRDEPPAMPTSGDVRLKGVVARSGTRPGGAIIAQGGTDAWVPVGGDIAPGVTLLEVHADHAILRRGGRTERIELEERASRIATPGLGARNLPPPPGLQMPTAPPPGLPPGMGMPQGMPPGAQPGFQQGMPQPSSINPGALPPVQPGAPGPVPRQIPGRSSTRSPTSALDPSLPIALDAGQAPSQALALTAWDATCA
jgi:general secretion pathway protein C